MSVPASSSHRTPAEQAAQLAWLLRVLAQVCLAVGLLLRAMARREAGDGPAAEADIRRALDRLDRIVKRLKARRQAELARAAASRGRGAAADEAAERALGAVTMMPARGLTGRGITGRGLTGRGLTGRGGGAARMRAWPRTDTDTTRPTRRADEMPLRGGWCGPPADRRSKMGSATDAFARL